MKPPIGRMLVVCSLAAAAAGAAPVPGVREVLARYERASGLKTASRTKMLVRKGYVLHGSSKVPFEWRAGLPGQWRAVAIWPGRGPITVAFDGRQGWRQENRSAVQFLGRDEALFESLLQDPYIVSRLKTIFPALSSVRAEKRQKRDVYVITARRPSDMDARILQSDPEIVFDAATGLLLQIGPVHFDNYREVQHLNLAHRISLGAEHMVYTITEVRMDAAIDPGEFRAR